MRGEISQTGQRDGRWKSGASKPYAVNLTENTRRVSRILGDKNRELVGDREKARLGAFPTTRESTRGEHHTYLDTPSLPETHKVGCTDKDSKTQREASETPEVDRERDEASFWSVNEANKETRPHLDILPTYPPSFFEGGRSGGCTRVTAWNSTI